MIYLVETEILNWFEILGWWDDKARSRVWTKPKKQKKRLNRVQNFGLVLVHFGFGFGSNSKIPNQTKTDWYVLNIIMYKIFQEDYH